MTEQVFPPLGHVRDPAREVEVRCDTCWPPALAAVLQRQDDGWQVWSYLHLSRKVADDSRVGDGPNEPRGRLLPVTSFGPSDVPQRRSVKLRFGCCKREEHVRRRRLYQRAEAAQAAGRCVIYGL